MLGDWCGSVNFIWSKVEKNRRGDMMVRVGDRGWFV